MPIKWIILYVISYILYVICNNTMNSTQAHVHTHTHHTTTTNYNKINVLCTTKWVFNALCSSTCKLNQFQFNYSFLQLMGMLKNLKENEKSPPAMLCWIAGIFLKLITLKRPSSFVPLTFKCPSYHSNLYVLKILLLLFN